MQWPTEKGQKTVIDKILHRKLKIGQYELHKTGGEVMCSGRVTNSFYSSDTHCVILVANPMVSHESGKEGVVITTNRTYPWSFVTDNPRWLTKS
jgi:hypothetical protein